MKLKLILHFHALKCALPFYYFMLYYGAVGTFFSARRRTMTTTTPHAGYLAPTKPGNLFPPLLPHQRKHMCIEHIDDTLTLTWYYKVVISVEK